MQLPIEWLPEQGRAEQLIVMLHGVGGSGADMAPLAQALRAQFPQAALLAPDAPHAFDGGGAGHAGRQWFSILDITEDNRAGRIQAALPSLWSWLRRTQDRLRVPPVATAIAGFSQGGILAMESAVGNDGLAGRVLAFSARFGTLPDEAPRHTTLHLFHGEADAVVPVAHARAAIERLAALQGDATIDIAEGVGHLLHPVLLNCALHRLKTHIPLRTWQAALGAAGARPPIPTDD